MANRYFRPHRMSSIKKVIRQWASVRKTYNNIESHSVTSDRFSCIMNITPSENSDTYKVEISYKADHFPRAKLLSHKLEERDGEFFKGHTANYLYIKVKTDKDIQNIILKIKLTEAKENLDIIGEIVV